MKIRVSNIAEVGLRVTDLPKMTAFYQKMLGFEHHLSLDNVVFLKVGELASPLGKVGHPLLLALFSREKTPDSERSTLDHLAFEIPGEDYEEQLMHFQAQEMVIHERAWPASLPWHGRSFFFRDPEDNVIELIASLTNPVEA